MVKHEASEPKSDLSPVVPEPWREQYVDLAVTTATNGQEYLYGIDTKGTKTRLSWGELDEAIDSLGYGVGQPAPGEAGNDGHPELEQLRNENLHLRDELQEAQEKNQWYEAELNTLRRQLDKLSEAHDELERRLANLEKETNGNSGDWEAELERLPKDIQFERLEHELAPVFGREALRDAVRSYHWRQQPTTDEAEQIEDEAKKQEAIELAEERAKRLRRTLMLGAVGGLTEEERDALPPDAEAKYDKYLELANEIGVGAPRKTEQEQLRDKLAKAIGNHYENTLAWLESESLKRYRQTLEEEDSEASARRKVREFVHEKAEDWDLSEDAEKKLLRYLSLRLDLELTKKEPGAAAKSRLKKLGGQVTGSSRSERKAPQVAVVRAHNGAYSQLSREEIEDIERRRRRRRAVAGALGAAAAVGVGVLIGYAVWKGGGHGANVSIINEHIDHLKGQINALKEQVLDQQRALKQAVAADRSQDAKILTAVQHLKESVSSVRAAPNFASFAFPWDWAKYVHPHNPEGYLHQLAAIAASHGHHVQWIREGFLPNGNPKEILRIDGTSNTQKVLQILSQYR